MTCHFHFLLPWKIGGGGNTLHINLHFLLVFCTSNRITFHLASYFKMTFWECFCWEQWFLSIKNECTYYVWLGRGRLELIRQIGWEIKVFHKVASVLYSCVHIDCNIQVYLLYWSWGTKWFIINSRHFEWQWQTSWANMIFINAVLLTNAVLVPLQVYF